jgi:hypothetical protein
MIDADKQLPLVIQEAHGTDDSVQMVYQIQAVGQAHRKPFNGDRQGKKQGSLGQPPYVPGEEMGMYHLKKGHCFNCYQDGHYSDRCLYERRAVKYDLCVNYRQQGHLMKDCPKEIII